MPEIKFDPFFDPFFVVPTASTNPPRRWETTYDLLGVGDVCCSCKRQITGSIKFIEFEDDELLKLPDLQTMRLEKEFNNV